MDQLSFASLDFAAKKKRTKRDVFLAEMATVVPWAALEGVIEPHYPKTGAQGGRRPFPLAVMLRIYCLQQWYNLSDPGAEEALTISRPVNAGEKLHRRAGAKIHHRGEQEGPRYRGPSCFRVSIRRGGVRA